MGLLRPFFCVLASLIILAPARAQEASPQPAGQHLFTDNLSALKPGGILHPKFPGCTSDSKNDFRGRACFYADDLLSPSAVIHALFSSSFAEWRNSPNIWHQDRDDMLTRFSFFYERKAARDGGEFLVGYLHHESFRRHTSGKTGFLPRSRAALLSVVRTSSEDGSMEFALAPVAGALGSGFVAAADYRNGGMFDAGLRHSGAVYGAYFGSAMFREFKPDLISFSNKLLRRSK